MLTVIGAVVLWVYFGLKYYTISMYQYYPTLQAMLERSKGWYIAMWVVLIVGWPLFAILHVAEILHDKNRIR